MDSGRSRSVRLAVLALALCAAAATPAPAAAVEVNVSGSAFADYAVYTEKALKQVGGAGGFMPEIAVKLDADVTDELSFSGRGCVGCHGLAVGHAQLEYAPSERFVVAAGRIAVPFGEASQRIDPSSYLGATKPLIFDMGRMPFFKDDLLNDGVLPLPLLDAGILVSGQFWPSSRAQVGWAAYAVGGLQGQVDAELRPSQLGRDNNDLPAGGGRLTLLLAEASPAALLGDVAIGGSFLAGRHDAAATRGYAAWGADLGFRVSRVRVRAEYAARRTELDPAAYPGRRLDKSGWYAELEHPVGRHLTAFYRHERLLRGGPLLTGTRLHEISRDGSFDLRRTTGGLELRPVSAIFVKASYEHYRPEGLASFGLVHLGVGGTF
jgi:hypothetical protein